MSGGRRQGRIAGAPISWGVCEAPEWGAQLPAESVLEELAAAGYCATEAGPDGYLPGDGAELRATLDAHRLQLAGAFLPVTLTDGGSRARARATFQRVLERLEGSPGAVVNLAPQGNRHDYDRRVELDAGEWTSTLAGLDELAAIAAGRGVPCALHPHAGTAVEREEDLERVLADSDIGLCLDTGHLLLGGIDPVQLTRDAADRIVHVHLKDVDANVADGWRRGGFDSMLDAIDAGLWQALGAGDARVDAVVDLLVGSGYDGWYVLERDTALAAADTTGDAREARIARAAQERAWVEARLRVRDQVAGDA